MRAWVCSRAGDLIEVLKLRTDLPAPPKPTGTDLLIKIDHAALNPADRALGSLLPPWLPFRRNPTPGFDYAGTVQFAGPLAPKKYAPGTQVCGCLSLKYILTGKGTLAEYLIVDSSIIAPKPSTLSSAEASGLGVTGQTVAIMMDAAKIKSGDRVLVNGASGGVGTLAVQIAKGIGAHVTATCSEAGMELVQRLGADEMVDYRANDPVHSYFEKHNSEQPFDHVLDTVGGQQLYEASPKFLKPTGVFVCIGAYGTQWEQWKGRVMNNYLPTWLGGTPRKWTRLGLLPTGELQRRVCKWAEDGVIKEVPIDLEVAFEDVRQVR